MTVQAQLERYLSEFRHRLRALIVARGAAVLSITALVVTLGAVYLGTRQAFANQLMINARLLLVLLLAGFIIGTLIYPLRALRRSEGVQNIERRAPDFDGRIETYRGLAKAAEDTEQRSPFLGLLAEDSLKIARRIPAALKVPNWEISVPTVLTAVAVVALIWFAAFGPDNWRYGVRHLWAGWAISDTLPPQRILVTPGDGAVRRGGDLEITAQAAGFDPLAAEVFALFEGSDTWESAPMDVAEDADGFDFRFFAVREQLRYYVTSAGVRSPEFEIQVVDLPRVNSIKLTYAYPRWTQLETVIEDPGYDIEAVAGTEVEVEIRTDQPLADAELVVNGDALTMSADGSVATATLEVTEEGEYFVTTLFNGDPVRLSDTYFIDAVPDNRPVVTVVKPGRDWRASNIEEVSVRVQASDDFGLDRLELHYAVNGGEWQVTPLDAEGDSALSEEILYLEDIDRFDESMVLEFLSGGDLADSDGGLEPGDLISYFAEAHDRGSSMRTDLYFVEVQPFDRSFTQSSQAGGGGGGGGGEQSEISQRQKEILIATWNLIREQEEQTGFQDEQQIQDNGDLLAELQRTLAEQAQTLASRTRARQLTSVDEQIQTFVQSLEAAAEAMLPAAERLANVEFDEAVPPEQRALQHLLRAESVFTDIQVAFQQGGGGGGSGGFAGRDLAELFELEMDLDKNQYETESAASFGSSNPEEQEIDEAIAKLQELARRQENLARQANQRNNALTEEERWQQEQLRRETEELRRELEQLRQAAANQQQSQPQSGQQSGQQSSSQASGAMQGQQGQQGQQAAEAIQQLENALQAMDRASGQSDENLDPEQARRAIEEARRQLDRALEQMTAQRREAAEEAFSDLSERSGELFDDQRQVAQELQQVARRYLEARERGESMRDVMSPEEAYDLADRKWTMQRVLEELEQDIQEVAQQFRGQTPGASEELQESLTDLQQSQAIARLGDAATRIRYGQAQEAAALEGITTTALDDLQRGTERALALASREAEDGVQPEPDPTAELLAELQSLRRELAQLSAGENQSQPGQPGQQGQGQAQGGQGGQQFGGAFGGNRFGGAYGSYGRGLRAWDPAGIAGFDASSQAELEDSLQEAGRDLLTLGSRLRTEGLTDAELEAVRRLGDALRGGLTGNPELIEQEFLAMLGLVEKLELQLAQNAIGVDESGVRTGAPDQVAQGYEEAVAEYFRRLSRGEQ